MTTESCKLHPCRLELGYVLLQQVLLMKLLENISACFLPKDVCIPCFKTNFLSPKESSHLAGVSFSDADLSACHLLCISSGSRENA